MTHIPSSDKRALCARESGFSLIVVLFFVGLIASIIAMSMVNQRGATQRDQAKAAGWHMVQVAKAARILVRDNSLDSSAAYHKTVLAGAPQEISIATLKSAGLLPSAFPEENSLGQAVRIFAANNPLDGDPAEAETVATAYVYLQPNSLTQKTASLMQEVAQGAQDNGLSIDAPIFTTGNVNVSDDCDGDGTPDVALWDSGCLDPDEFLQITGVEFVPGALIAPAWRSQDFDTRAIMRYPQPENPGFATMMTAMEMGTPITDADGNCTDFVQVHLDGAGSGDDTAICNVENDDITTGDWQTGDRRVDIMNADRVEAQSVIARHQGANEWAVRLQDDGSVTDFTEPKSLGTNANEVMGTPSNIFTAGDVQATGSDFDNIRASDGLTTVTFLDDLDVDHNIAVTNGSGLSMQVSNNSAIESGIAGTRLGANDLRSTAGVSGRTGGTNLTLVTSTMTVEGDCGGEECGLVTLDMDATGQAVNADNADLFKSFNATSLTVEGNASVSGNPPALVAYELRGSGNLNAQGTMNVDESLVIDGQTSVLGSTVIDSCVNFFGRCPNITQDPPDAVVE